MTDSEREYRLRYYYHMTIEQFARILSDEQDGRCAICGTENPGSMKGWHIDHNHTCCPGKYSCGRCVRGILCHGCNTGLSMGDNVYLLERKAQYLLAWEGMGRSLDMRVTYTDPIF